MINDVLEFFERALPHIGQRYSDLFFNGFEEKSHHPVKLSHFSPCTCWKGDDDSLYLIDSLNGDRYFNDSAKTKRLKCLGLVASTLIVHAVSHLIDLVNRIVKLITFAHFWHSCNGRDYQFGARLLNFGTDLLRIVWAPISYVGMELSAIYGLILPKEGGKLYASFERLAFDGPILAPCFQPSPEYHLGGGDMNKKDSW